MCCFSARVNAVTDTNIFARSSAAGRQFLVYSMKYEAASELAMILPLPTPPAAPEDAVQFIDLSGYPEFFADLRKGFPEPVSRHKRLSLDLAPQPATLKVYEVGSFEASFAPQQQDFARLDPRFRLPDTVWRKLPQYRDWGFAVFKLKVGAKTVHPMAFEFPRRKAGELFFPTVHIHHGRVEAKAKFDHTLFCQRDYEERDWETSATIDGQPWPANQFMDIARTQDILNPASPVQRRRIQGKQKNEDIIIRI